MPKITFKKAFFRIFWKILAKTSPQSLYLCGFPEARVEMKVAPFRALIQIIIYMTQVSFSPVEMKVAPFRELTQSIVCLILNHFKLETKLAPPMAYRPTTKRPVNFPLRSESSLVLFCIFPGTLTTNLCQKQNIILFYFYGMP